jgi:hypothetical protein
VDSSKVDSLGIACNKGTAGIRADIGDTLVQSSSLLAVACSGLQQLMAVPLG